MLIAAVILSGCINMSQDKPKKVTYDEIIQYIYNDEVVECVLYESLEIKLTLTDEGASRAGASVMTHKLSNLGLFEKNVGEILVANLLDPTSNLEKYDVIKKGSK